MPKLTFGKLTLCINEETKEKILKFVIWIKGRENSYITYF